MDVDVARNECGTTQWPRGLCLWLWITPTVARKRASTYVSEIMLFRVPGAGASLAPREPSPPGISDLTFFFIPPSHTCHTATATQGSRARVNPHNNYSARIHATAHSQQHTPHTALCTLVFFYYGLSTCDDDDNRPALACACRAVLRPAAAHEKVN